MIKKNWIDFMVISLKHRMRTQPTNTNICGNFNVKIGLRTTPSQTVLGNYSTTGRNERGKKLFYYLLEKSMYQMNSFFFKKLHKRWM